jgi:hypothetical protein
LLNSFKNSKIIYVMEKKIRQIKTTFICNIIKNVDNFSIAFINFMSKNMNIIKNIYINRIMVNNVSY